MAHRGVGKQIKLKGGKKYTRLQKVETVSPSQKKILKKFAQPVKPEQYKPSKLSKLSASALRQAVRHGPPTSPVEQTGQTFLQNLLGRTPEEQYQNFAAPYMRQYQEEIVPGIAERFAGLGQKNSSGLQQTLARAGTGLAENLASLKGNLINQLLSQQTQGANVGLGYAQLPSQRWGQQLGAAQIGAQAGLIPQHEQEALNQYAANKQYQQQANVLGTPETAYYDIPARGKRPGFWQGAGPRLAGAGLGAGIGALFGGPAGALAGAGLGSSLGGGGGFTPIPMAGGGGGGAARSFMEAPQAASGFFQ